jgi:hypothetical protein
MAIPRTRRDRRQQRPAAVRTRAAVNGREAIVIEYVIRMARDVAPAWLTSDFDATYRVDIEGDPDIER